MRNVLQSWISGPSVSVIVTSSSDEKIKRACVLGASDGVNYKRFPDWSKEAMPLTGGRGADHILKNGGAGSLTRSFEAAAFGGKVALIGAAKT
jgi:NADPH:quinone reductase-like Zn-dependent oxidoreductase